MEALRQLDEQVAGLDGLAGGVVVGARSG